MSLSLNSVIFIFTKFILTLFFRWIKQIPSESNFSILLRTSSSSSSENFFAILFYRILAFMFFIITHTCHKVQLDLLLFC